MGQGYHISQNFYKTMAAADKLMPIDSVSQNNYRISTAVNQKKHSKRASMPRLK
jgi:hypothetical protein